MTIQSFATRVLSCGIVAGSLLLVACDADLTGPEESLITAEARSAQEQNDSHRGARRVKLCHRTDDGGYTKITMAHAALGAHIAHGDAGIGDAVPGMAGYAFDETCQPVGQVQEQTPAIEPSSISAGTDHSCGLDGNGAAYCWGANYAGQLGDGTTIDRSEPVAVAMAGVPAFASIRAGGSHTVALTADGQAYAWGDNSNGQLGDGSWAASATPVAVSVPAGVSFTAIGAGTYHSLAVASTGEAYGWGYNAYGTLGDGSTTQTNAPVAAIMPDGVSFTAIDAGTYHSVALASTGEAYAWGVNTMGQVGTTLPSWYTSQPAAVDMPAGVSFTAIDAGPLHNVALDADGAAYAWGSNGQGQLGDGTTTNRGAPVAVSMNGETFSAISAGTSHTTALTTNGQARGWGLNGHGQLGDGTTSGSTVPTAVTGLEGTTLAAISAGGGHTLTLSSAGAAHAWGYNYYGQVGDGSTTNQTVPVAVAGGVVFQ